MTLYINACPRKESRTDELARELLDVMGVSYTERRLADEPLSVLSEERLAYRTEQIAKKNFYDPMFLYAREFANADTIVISAPFWDLSFPALLKLYIENIYVTGLVSKYDEDGTPRGLCRADKLYYVTTAGGLYDPRYSYNYIRELCTEFFGIPNVRLIKAETLDIVGYDASQILQDAKNKIRLDIASEQ